MAFPTVPPGSLPWLTVGQMAEADRLAVDVFGIGLLQMMEHAGASLAELVIETTEATSITVMAGGGNNGGGGLCAARHLINRGRDVTVVMATERHEPAVDHHLRTLRAMDAPFRSRPAETPVVVDALVGYGLKGPLRGRAAELAAWSAGRTIISLDFPSGHGHAGAVEPSATLTLALPKEELRDARPLFLADLGLPEALWARIGIDASTPFTAAQVVEIG